MWGRIQMASHGPCGHDLVGRGNARPRRAMTRREFATALFAGLPAISTASLFRGSAARAGQTPTVVRSSNRSLIGGVPFGLQPFCYHDLAMTPDNRGTLLERLVQNRRHDTFLETTTA